MKNYLRLLAIAVTLLISSCATSMTPAQFSAELPKRTKSIMISRANVESLVQNNKCKYIAKGRVYNAPIGLTTSGDLTNAAKGIDEWVELDKGNSYVITNFKWVTIDSHGSTQLQVEFDTMNCN